ncbi:hypothetical protein ABH935_005359 [Catenulispora sp. GAS73]|uniref:hypothetical protein n=1 Tax=Catenulispora sp. GAS73 TaxID=3156269 RepID=UPI003512DDAC
MTQVSWQEQEAIESIIAGRCPDATDFLDFDAEGMDVLTTRLGGVYDVILCLGTAFTSLHTRDELQAAFRTFAAHARIGTQLIVRKPEAVHQAVLEWRARSYRFGFYASFSGLRVFGYGAFDPSDYPDDGGF